MRIEVDYLRVIRGEPVWRRHVIEEDERTLSQLQTQTENVAGLLPSRERSGVLDHRVMAEQGGVFHTVRRFSTAQAEEHYDLWYRLRNLTEALTAEG